MEKSDIKKIEKLKSQLEKIQDQLRDIADNNNLDYDSDIRVAAFNLDDVIYKL
jgi:hypothetical protein